MMKSAVIDKNKAEQHTIDKYRFRVLATAAPAASKKESVFAGSEEAVATPAPATEAPVQSESETVSAGSRDELVESLLKKADEMSSSVIKMQMKLEEAEANYKAQLEVEKQQAYEEGIQTGRTQMAAESNQAQEEGISRFATSVQTLEARASEFGTALESVKQELLHAALEIAKEVISIETSERSSQIAQKLSEQLIEELREASKVTLRVNPADHGKISEAVGSLEHINVVSDSAVGRGGVVAISDAGNIDAEIMKRFERIKNAAFSG